MPLPREPPRRDLQFRPLLHGSLLILPCPAPCPATQTFLTNTNYFSSLIEITFLRGRLIGKRKSSRECRTVVSSAAAVYCPFKGQSHDRLWGHERYPRQRREREREDSKTKQQRLHETERTKVKLKAHAHSPPLIAIFILWYVCAIIGRGTGGWAFFRTHYLGVIAAFPPPPLMGQFCRPDRFEPTPMHSHLQRPPSFPSLFAPRAPFIWKFLAIVNAPLKPALFLPPPSTRACVRSPRPLLWKRAEL